MTEDFKFEGVIPLDKTQEIIDMMAKYKTAVSTGHHLAVNIAILKELPLPVLIEHIEKLRDLAKDFLDAEDEIYASFEKIKNKK